MTQDKRAGRRDGMEEDKKSWDGKKEEIKREKMRTRRTTVEERERGWEEKENRNIWLIKKGKNRVTSWRKGREKETTYDSPVEQWKLGQYQAAARTDSFPVTIFCSSENDKKQGEIAAEKNYSDCKYRQ